MRWKKRLEDWFRNEECTLRSPGILLCRNRPISFKHFAWTIVSFEKR